MNTPGTLYYSLKFMHCKLTAFILWWAIVLAIPGNHVFSTSISFDLFSAVMAEQHWSIFFLAVASMGIIGTRLESFRVSSAWLLCVCHGMIAGMLAYSTFWSTGTGIYAIIAATASYHLFQMGRPNRIIRR